MSLIKQHKLKSVAKLVSKQARAFIISAITFCLKSRMRRQKNQTPVYGKKANCAVFWVEGGEISIPVEGLTFRSAIPRVHSFYTTLFLKTVRTDMLQLVPYVPTTTAKVRFIRSVQLPFRSHCLSLRLKAAASCCFGVSFLHSVGV